jgi:M6 family metalloprotease-like protein
MEEVFSDVSKCFTRSIVKLSCLSAVIILFLIILLAKSYASNDVITGLTILIDFSDCPQEIPKKEMDDLINKTGYSGFGNNGSMRDYFYDISEGKLLYNNDVFGYYRAKNPKSYYNDINSKGRDKELVYEALEFMKQSGYDFSKLTINDSKMAVAVNVLYAGERNVYWGVGLWPRQGEIDKFYVGDIYISKYQISNIGTSPTIGTLVHENCHLLFDYPDLYDYQDDSTGVGQYCIMGRSSDKTNPQPPNAFLRSVISGWGNVTKLNDVPDNTKVTIKANSPDVFIYYGPYANEFFVIECIAKKGRWSSMPDEGLAIWHVDVNGRNDYQDMSPDRHYMVSLEQADGLNELEKNINGGGEGDLFHYGYKDRFDVDTSPDSKWWDGNESGFGISDISAIGDIMTFVVHNKNNPIITEIPTATPTPTWTATPPPTVTPTSATPTAALTSTLVTTPISTQSPTPVQTITLTATITPTPTIMPTPTPDPHVIISGYIFPDFFTVNDNPIVREGFAVRVQGTDIWAMSDKKGYFQLSGLKKNEDGYNLIITKPNYFKCSIKTGDVVENMIVIKRNNPIIMWCGDVNQDGTINLIDIIRLALLFNSIEGDSKYDVRVDFNLDGVINLRDFYVVSRHFNQTVDDFIGSTSMH